MKIGVLLTTQCNMSCWYCDHKKLNAINMNQEIDVPYLTHVLSMFPKHLHVELSGGEPGIIANLLEVIDEISDLPNVDSIDVLSNGLAYMRYGSDLFKNSKLKSYREHWFGGEFKNPHSKYEQVVVLSEDNLEHFFLKIGMFYKDSPISDKRIEFKVFTPKVCYLDDGYFKKCVDFYNYIRYYLTNPITLEHIDTQLKFIQQRESLGINSPCYLLPKNVFINLETKSLHQCSMVVTESMESAYSLSQSNIDLLVKGKLFTSPMPSCSKCYKYDAEYSKSELLRYLNNRQ